MVSLEQVTTDNGPWDLAWTYQLMEEALHAVQTRRRQQSFVQAFPRLADQIWNTTALAYIKEMDSPLVAASSREGRT